MFTMPTLNYSVNILYNNNVKQTTSGFTQTPVCRRHFQPEVAIIKHAAGQTLTSSHSPRLMSFDSSASSGDNSSDVDVSAPRDVIYDDTSNSQPRHALDLHTACAIGHFDCVMRLIASRSRSLDINEKNRGGWTPLMYASYVGHDKIVDLLLEKSADVNVAACDGGTALMWAASCGNEAVAYFLLLVRGRGMGWTDG